MTTSTAPAVNTGPNVPLRTAFDLYLARLRARNRADRTIDKYRRGSRSMIASLAAHGAVEIGQVQRTHIDDWTIDMSTAGLDTNTIRSQLGMAMGFFRDLRDRNDIAANPMAGYPRPKVVKRLLPFCPASDVQVVLGSIDGRTFFGARLRLLLTICYYSGLRLDEALRLRWCDYDAALRQFGIVGKGGKVRHQPVSDVLAGALASFHSGLKVSPTPVSPILASRRGNHWKAKDVYPALARFGLKGMGARLWRRSALTNMVSSGVPVHWASDFAGHASIATTGLYLQVPPPQVWLAASALADPSAASSGTNPQPAAASRRQPAHHYRRRRRWARRARTARAMAA